MANPPGFFVDETGRAHVPFSTGTTNAPADGTWAVGNLAVTTAGVLKVCTVAGTPGTWATVSGGGGTAATTTFTPAAGIAASDVQAAIQEAVTDAAATYAPISLSTSAQTASYTLVLGDAGKVVEMNSASATNITIPPNSSVAFPVGTTIEFCQVGTAQFTIVGGAGVQCRSEGDKFRSAAQYATVTARQRATDEWVISGDLVTYGPLEVAGLVYWFRGDGNLWTTSARSVAATADGDRVGSWDDSSLGAAHAINATAGERGTLKTGANGINGKPVIRFDGLDDNLVSPAAAGTKPFTIFAVVKPTNFTAINAVVGTAASSGMGFVITTGAKQELVHNGVAVIADSTTSLSAATAVLMEATYSSAGVYTFYKNGAADGTGTNNKTFNAQTTHIGRDPGTGGYPFLGDIAEIIKYDTVLSASDLQLVENYLGTKYGITVT